MGDREMVSFEILNSGEYVGVSIVEVSKIPDFSIISSKYRSAVDADLDYKRGMISLLNEVYQSYRAAEMYTGTAPDISLELLWITEPVRNQPYNAKIRLFLLVRAIGNDKGAISQTITQMVKISNSVLALQKYEFEDVAYADFHPLINSICTDNIKALIKEEKLENLQNQLLPQCLSFGRIPPSESNLSRLVNALIEYPNCAVSLQLIPAKLSSAELESLGRIRQMLDILTRGVTDQNIGNVSFSLAERHAETYKFYEENKNGAIFQFNLLFMERIKAQIV